METYQSQSVHIPKPLNVSLTSHPCPDWFSCLKLGDGPAATRPETPGGPCWPEGMAAEPRCPCLPWLPSETHWGPHGPPLTPHSAWAGSDLGRGSLCRSPGFLRWGTRASSIHPRVCAVTWPVWGEGARSQEGVRTGWDLGKGPGVSRDGGIAGIWRAGGGGEPSHFTRNLGDRGARISVCRNTGTRVCRTLRGKHLRAWVRAGWAAGFF